jgi:hypothetical protein
MHGLPAVEKAEFMTASITGITSFLASYSTSNDPYKTAVRVKKAPEDFTIDLVILLRGPKIIMP